MTIKIVTDSTLAMPPEKIKELGITIVPLSYSIDGVIYTDGDLILSQYLEKVDASNSLPKTSQPAVGIFSDVFRRLSADGSEIISIHLTGNLSGTVEAARQGAALTGAKVTVVDSTSVDQGLSFQVEEAALMAKAGKSRDEILSALTDLRNKTELYCGVVTLENLIKGGRIGRVSGFIGSLMDIKVLLYLKDGELQQLRKGRGNKIFTKWLDEFTAGIVTSGRKVREIGISHVENPEFAKLLYTAFQKFTSRPIEILNTSAIIATHTGRGTWALMIAYE